MVLNTNGVLERSEEALTCASFDSFPNQGAGRSVLLLMPYLTSSFFRRDVLTVARELVGVELVWQGCSGIIVETEAYAVDDDPACHTATRPSARAFLQAMPTGTAYVYFNYGMHWMLNLLVKGGGRDGLILIRALEPVVGIGQMQQRRQREKLRDLC